jgi:2-hydroxychromene-2-carboxylate isomerase
MTNARPPIEVFADIWCPFAHVGLRAVQQQRGLAQRVGVPLRVRSWPLELVNRQPLDPSRTADHVEDLKRQVAPELFRGFDPAHFPRSTMDALALAAAGYRKDDATGEAISFALRDALFEAGLDVSDPVVLDGIARPHGVAVAAVDREAVQRDWDEGTRRGVQGSPHFFCGDSSVFCPSLSITGAPGAEHLRLEVDRARLHDFLKGCFGA